MDVVSFEVIDVGDQINRSVVCNLNVRQIVSQNRGQNLKDWKRHRFYDLKSYCLCKRRQEWLE